MCGWTASSERVDAVLFDLGNTLVSYYTAADFGPVLERCVASAAAVLPQHIRSGDHSKAVYERALAANAERADHGVRPLEERLVEIFRLDARLARPELLERLGAAFLAPIFATARPDPDAVDVLTEIKSLGLKTAIVSNTPWGTAAAPWRAELARHGLLEQRNNGLSDLPRQT